MRQADVDPAHAQSVGVLASRTAQFDRRPPARLTDHLDVHPANAEPPAGAESLHRGFLGCEPRGVALGRTAMAFAVRNLPRSEHALKKGASVPLNCGFDAVDLGDVRAQADDHIVTILENSTADKLQ